MHKHRQILEISIAKYWIIIMPHHLWLSSSGGKLG